MTINQLIKADKISLSYKNPHRRIYYLNRAMNRAKNPEWKDLWKRKKEELLRIYNTTVINKM